MLVPNAPSAQKKLLRVMAPLPSLSMESKASKSIRKSSFEQQPQRSLLAPLHLPSAWGDIGDGVRVPPTDSVGDTGSEVDNRGRATLELLVEALRPPPARLAMIPPATRVAGDRGVNAGDAEEDSEEDRAVASTGSGRLLV
mmetsp:Transcript_58374/g.131521  ORF Transcript_58374/g.131521 Transcript_58374/m.131521 type:complete len:141 (-) Transcript_58374:307-729(-)